MVEIKTCRKCGYVGDNFTPKDVNNWCRTCRSKRNKSHENPKFHGDQNKRSNTYKKWGIGLSNKCVYAIYCKFTKEIVYIGESNQAPRRMFLHFRDAITGTSKIFTKHLLPDERCEYYHYKELWNGNDDNERKQKEIELIRKYKPILNKIV